MVKNEKTLLPIKRRAKVEYSGAIADERCSAAIPEFLQTTGVGKRLMSSETSEERSAWCARHRRYAK
jgi:hypothetical protein